VLEHGRLLRTLGLEFRYLLFEGLRARLSDRGGIARRLARLRRQFDASIEIRYLPAPLGNTGMWLAAVRIARAGRDLAADRLLIQARGSAAACAALGMRRRLRSARVLYDARGDEAAEARLEASLAATRRRRAWWTRRARRMEELQRRAGSEADHILAVSTPLKERICSASGTPPERVTVVPCCVDPRRIAADATVRADVRRRLGIDGRFVLVYSGSLTAYQIPDQVGRLVEAIQRGRPQTHLLLLTRDRAGALRWFGHLAQTGSMTLVEAPYDEVGDYLAAADAALLLRRDDPVNRVACPVKFAEYIVSGLPVIMTPRIGDLGDYIRDTGHGVLVDLDRSPEDQANQVLQAVDSARWIDRAEIRRRGLETFRRESYGEVYRELLARLGILPPGDACAS
jgi:glycosyltransferase involved in cell wall biosynthesis